MNTQEKKLHMLLKTVIFHYHGVSDEDKRMLEEAATKYQAEKELEWAYDFVQEDFSSAFKRARAALQDLVKPCSKTTRLYHMRAAWDSCFQKGYLTDIESTSLLEVAKDWGIEKEILQSTKT